MLHKSVKSIFLGMAVAMYHWGSGIAQTLPDYQLDGFLSGQDKSSIFHSDKAGYIVGSGHPASFHYFSLLFKSAARMSFKVSCKFVNNANARDPIDAVSSNGAPCPVVGVPNSNYVSAFRVELEGPDSGLFRLMSACWTQTEQPGGITGRTEYARRPAEEWCGETSRASDNVHFRISRIELWLLRR